jgi:hypothetical protein
MVDFVCVLPLCELAVEKGDILIRFILQNFHPLSASSLILARHSHGIQLSNLENKKVYLSHISIGTRKKG